MKPVFQDDEYSCGAACLAMLADISYREARRHLFGPAGPTSDGVSRKPLLAALTHFGFRPGPSKRIKRGSLASLKHNALLHGKLLPTRGTIDAEKTEGHWLVWDARERVVRDPYGHKKPFWLTSYTVVEPK